MDLDLYQAARPSIKTGDAIAWQSRSIVGKLIQWWCRSPLNHISIAIRFNEYDQDRVYILEELEHGAVLFPLSRRLEETDGRAWVYPLIEGLDSIRVPFASWSLSMQGTPYDYKGLAQNVLGRVSADIKAMYCSEYYWLGFKEGVYRSHNKDGMKLYNRAILRLHNLNPRPSDFPLFQKIGIFKKEIRIK